MTRSRTRHIATYAGMLHEGGCELAGRVLGRPANRDVLGSEIWWQSIRSSWHRFDTETVAGARVELSFRGETTSTVTDAKGYYAVTLPVSAAPGKDLWEIAEATLESGEDVLQPVLCVPQGARIGVISDIDDIILKSSVTRWQIAARLLFMRTARTRKPLEGVAALYRAWHCGPDGNAANPIFYVSASPWNLYDLLEDFLQLNSVPIGPMLLRDVELDAMSWRDASQAQNKIMAMELLIERYPRLQWLLVGDSGQVEARHYEELALRHPGRILAVYLRESEAGAERRRENCTASGSEGTEGAGVPIVRVKDCNDIAAHARSLGLIQPGQLPDISEEVHRDHARPQQQVNGIPPLTGQVESVA